MTLLSGYSSVLRQGRRQAEPQLVKLRQMQHTYLERNPRLYSARHSDQIQRTFEAVEHKFYLNYIHLEELWVLSEEARVDLFDALANSLDRLTWDEDQQVLGSLFLESFLFQARSFLDVFMFYICLVMGIEDPGYMKVQKFYNYMESDERGPFQERANQLADYFRRHVFGDENWGELVCSLRDKIAHRDRLRPSFEGTEELLGEVLLDWPTLRGLTYERFCQDMHTGLYEMIRHTSQTLFELEWRAGPYRPDMWDRKE